VFSFETQRKMTRDITIRSENGALILVGKNKLTVQDGGPVQIFVGTLQQKLKKELKKGESYVFKPKCRLKTRGDVTLRYSYGGTSIQSITTTSGHCVNIF
jgi:hypothetical protein